MFEKTLTDLVKGIRAHPHDEASYISGCLAEIKEEVKSKSHSMKQQAVLKLVYLQMLGHDVSWAAFHFVDVMAQPRFRAKRIGTLAVAQTFHDGTEVALLTTNLYRKAISSSSQFEVSMSLSCLAKVATPELSRDLLSDVVSMLGSTRPLIRKKAVVCAYKLLCRCPEALPGIFPRLQQRLDDASPSVVACTVNVMCELIAINPGGYLGLAPALYGLLMKSSCNWTRIKVLRCLRSLIPLEPRLGRKMVQPLTHIIETTAAKSLQFECLATIASTMTVHADVTQLACTRLREFVTHNDPNLKYIGLQAFASLQVTQKELVSSCYGDVLGSLHDADLSVRSKALVLVTDMATRSNLVELVAKLMELLDSPNELYRDQVISVVLAACRADGFSRVPSFRWLVSVLLALGQQPSAHNPAIADLLMEVALRVPAVRCFAAESALAKLLAAASQQFVDPPPAATLCAAAWILAEHGALLPAPSQLSALRAMVSSPVASLPAEVQASFVQATLRVFAMLPIVGSALENPVALLGPATDKEAVDRPDAPMQPCGEQLQPLVGELLRQLCMFCESLDFEVQERARTTRALLAELHQAVDAGEAAELLRSLRSALAPEIKPVASHAQRKVKPLKLLLEWDHAPEVGEESGETQEQGGANQASPHHPNTAGTAVSSAATAPPARRNTPQSPYYLPSAPVCAAGMDSAASETPLDGCVPSSPDCPGADGAEPVASSETLVSGVGALAAVLQPHEWQDDEEALVNLDEDEPSETGADAHCMRPNLKASQYGMPQLDQQAAPPSLIDLTDGPPVIP